MGLCCSNTNCRRSSSDKCKSPCSPVPIQDKLSCVLSLRDRDNTHVEVSLVGNIAPLSRSPDFHAMSKLATIVKGKVSKKRIRYQQDGYDLDLTYITPNIIAMGYPASNIEAVYRNNIEDVARFLDGAHKDHYKIYNLCSERSYDTSKFHNRVEVFPFDDHNPPKLELIEPFCNSVQGWLQENSANVAVVHCKAGKGRTGTMICCYLLHSGKFSNSEDALNHYGGKRTEDMKGVTIPSQLRYVNYYARLVRDSIKYRPVQVYIKEVILEPSPCFSGGNMGTLCFSISQPVTAESQNGQPYEKLKKVLKSEEHDVKKSVPKFSVQLDSCSPLVGDVKVEFYYKMLRKEKLFQFWFNTFFVCEKVHVYDSNGCVNRNGSSTTTDELLQQQTFKFTLSKKELDIVNKKDKQNKTFSSDFHITLLLSRVPTRNPQLNRAQSNCTPSSNLPPLSQTSPAHHNYSTNHPHQSIYPHSLHHVQQQQQQQHGNGSVIQQLNREFLMKQQQMLNRQHQQQQQQQHNSNRDRPLPGIPGQGPANMHHHSGMMGAQHQQGTGLLTSASQGMIPGKTMSSAYATTKTPPGFPPPPPQQHPHQSSSMIAVPHQLQQQQSSSSTAAIINNSDSSTSSSDDDSSDGCCGGGGGGGRDKGDDDDTNDEYNWDSGESQSVAKNNVAISYDNMNCLLNNDDDEQQQTLLLLPRSRDSVSLHANTEDVPRLTRDNDAQNLHINFNTEMVIVLEGGHADDDDADDNLPQSETNENNDLVL